MMMFIRYHMILGLASSYPIWYFLENDVCLIIIKYTQISMFADMTEQWDEYMIEVKY